MMNNLTNKEKEDYIMNYLQEKGITLSRAAVMIMLEDGVSGMCTEEAPVTWYNEALICARKIGYCE